MNWPTWLPATWEQYFKDYFIIIVGAGLVILWLLISHWLDLRRRRQMLEKVMPQAPTPHSHYAQPPPTNAQYAAPPYSPQGPPPSPYPTMLPQPDFNIYREDKPYIPHDPLLDRVRTMSTALQDDHHALNRGMIEDYRRVEIQLKEVQTKREEIRAHGIELGKLFDKYREREQQLMAMKDGMRRILDQTPSGLAGRGPTPQGLNTSARQ